MPRVRSMLLQDPDGEGVSEMVVMVNKVSQGREILCCQIRQPIAYASLQVPSDLRLVFLTLVFMATNA